MVTKHDGKIQGVAATGLVIVAACLANAQTSADLEIKRAYTNLIDAENRHDLAAGKGMVWGSPSVLLVAKAPVGWRGYWGIDDVIQHLHDMYQQPFRIDPNYDEEKMALITPDVAQPYAPVKITVAYGGQNLAPKPFIIVLLGQNAEWVADDDGHPDSCSARPRVTLNE